MAKISTGQSFNAGDQLTSTKLNNIVGSAFLDSDSITGTTLNLSNGQLKVATNGVTSNELKSDASVDANRAVGTNHIKDNAVTEAKIANGAVTASKLFQINNLTAIGNTSGSASTPSSVSILDEDDMASDSATSLATQQSIKAYVDNSAVTVYRSWEVEDSQTLKIACSTSEILLLPGDQQAIEITNYLSIVYAVGGSPREHWVLWGFNGENSKLRRGSSTYTLGSTNTAIGRENDDYSIYARYTNGYLYIETEATNYNSSQFDGHGGQGDFLNTRYLVLQA